MSESLYSRLFRYRQREKRAPLEDYLSEALADFLNRLSKAAMIDFVINVALAKVLTTSKTGWKLIAEKTKQFEWRTQYSIKDSRGVSRRLDICLFGDGKPLLIIENKIYAEISQHPNDATNPATIDQEQVYDRNQLSEYGSWLKMHTRVPKSAALVLLTHRTPPPQDYFEDPFSHYGVITRSVCKWHEIAQWLLTLSKSANETLRIFARELAGFLEDKSMSTKPLRSRDIAAAESFLESHERIATLFDEIKQAIIMKAKALGINYVNRPNWIPPTYESGSHMVWDWIMLPPDQAKQNSDWWLGWGIQYAEGSDDHEWRNTKPALPNGDRLFFALSRDGNEAFPEKEIPSELRNKGWARVIDDGDWIAASPLYPMFEASDTAAEVVSQWILGKMSDVPEVLRCFGISISKK